jgi:hypothetical protein
MGPPALDDKRNGHSVGCMKYDRQMCNPSDSIAPIWRDSAEFVKGVATLSPYHSPEASDKWKYVRSGDICRMLTKHQSWLEARWKAATEHNHRADALVLRPCNDALVHRPCNGEIEPI